MSENTTIVVDLSRWTRLPEVLHYAQERDNITVQQAILELVNAGLSV